MELLLDNIKIMWSCYLLQSLTSNRTYIGSTNNPRRRLQSHNTGKGAKYTRGQKWIPVIIIDGFENKISCLSFEAGWKKLSKNRKIKHLERLNQATGYNFRYTKDTKWNRLVDLLFFLYNMTYIDNHFKLNTNSKYPIIYPDHLIINIFMEDWIADLPFPHFVSVKIIN